MNEDIQNIGLFNYLWIIITGKNREIAEIKKRNYNDDKYIEEVIGGDFIITIGKKAIILTKYRNGRREPVIVRKWQKTQNDNFVDFVSGLGKLSNSTFRADTFIDNAGYKWTYCIDDNQWITVHEPDNGKIIYEIKIK